MTTATIVQRVWNYCNQENMWEFDLSNFLKENDN